MHLAQRQIEGYARRELPPGELLAVDDHLAECAACRLAVAERMDLAPALAAWETLGKREVRLPAERGEAALVQALLGEKPPRRNWAATLAWAASLALAAALAAWLLLGRADGEGEEAVVASGPSLGATSDPAPESPAPDDAAPARPEGAQEDLSSAGTGSAGVETGDVLADGRRRLVLSPDRLTGLEGVSATLGRLVREAWMAGRLATPALLADLRTGSEVLRSGSAARDFAPLDPVGRVVRAGAPTFRWAPLPGAESYRVRVFDLSFRVVAESPLLEAASGSEGASGEWTPAESLPRGVTYTWQVSARRGQEEQTAPEPARGEARFQVLPATALREIESAEALKPPSRLLLATLYARAGLLPEAERELARLAEENPDSTAVRRLQASLKAGS